MSNEEIVCRIQSGGDPEGELMTQLWEQNRAFVIKLARRYRGLAEEDDLVQEAFFGLLQAVRHWDPENGVLFLSYAGYWIQAKMTRSIDRSGVTSIAMRQSIQKYRRFLSKYKSEHGTEPTQAEISEGLHITEKRLKRIMFLDAANIDTVTSLDTPCGDEGGKETALSELLQDGTNFEDDLLDKLESEQLHKELWEEVDALPDKMPEIIRKRFQGQMTREQVAKECGCSASFVRTLEEKGLRKLKRSKRLKAYEVDYISTHAFRSSLSSFNHTWTSSTERTAMQLME